MIKIPISSMVSPRSVTFKAATRLSDGTEVQNAIVDVYAGWFRIDFAVGDEDDPDFEEFKTFLPLDGNRRARRYVGTEKFEFAISAAPSGYSSTADAEDDPSTTAVNSAFIALEPQSLSMIAGSPMMLVLRGRIAAQRSTIFTITYHVTVAGAQLDVSDVTIPVGATPA
ncbi:hypothetical protein [Nocardia asiatica]|uniref:hypothetical protein n=1 Tax=Nocardia asiatica TaxID=209252 RepID=UPI002456F0BC|nr:hypothetical protein [Nocardia asiatica]